MSQSDADTIKSLKELKGDKIVDEILSKSKQIDGLVPKKVMVTRDGKTFQQTVYVKPGEEAPKHLYSVNMPSEVIRLKSFINYTGDTPKQVLLEFLKQEGYTDKIEKITDLPSGSWMAIVSGGNLCKEHNASYVEFGGGERNIIIGAGRTKIKSVILGFKPYKKGSEALDKSNESLKQLFYSGKRKEAMYEAKKLGINWGESEHPGINWMRASMAIKKYLGDEASMLKPK